MQLFYCLDLVAFMSDSSSSDFNELCHVYKMDINMTDALLEFRTMKEVYSFTKSQLKKELTLCNVL